MPVNQRSRRRTKTFWQRAARSRTYVYTNVCMYAVCANTENITALSQQEAACCFDFKLQLQLPTRTTLAASSTDYGFGCYGWLLLLLLSSYGELLFVFVVKIPVRNWTTAHSWASSKSFFSILILTQELTQHLNCTPSLLHLVDFSTF